MLLIEKLHRAKARLGLSGADIAREVGCHPETIRCIFEGLTKEPGFFLVKRLAAILEVPLDWLADDAADWPPPASDEQKATDIVKELLASRGVGGDLTDDERQCLAAFRAMDEATRTSAIAFLRGMIAGRQIVTGRDLFRRTPAALAASALPAEEKSERQLSPEQQRAVDAALAAVLSEHGVTEKPASPKAKSGRAAG